MIFKIDMNTEGAISHLKKIGIVDNIKSEMSFFVNASEPDEACSQALIQLRNRILAEKHDPQVLEAVEEIQFDVRVTKIRAVRPLDR